MDLLDPAAVAPLLGCTPETVEDRLRDGTLPGVKLGRSWVIPARALEQRLCDLAMEQAAERRQQPPATAEIFPALLPARTARARRDAPKLEG